MKELCRVMQGKARVRGDERIQITCVKEGTGPVSDVILNDHGLKIKNMKSEVWKHNDFYIKRKIMRLFEVVGAPAITVDGDWLQSLVNSAVKAQANGAWIPEARSC